MPTIVQRVLVDGVFDCPHFGHANCFRKAKMFGEEVVAGIHPDSDVVAFKHCQSVFTEIERYNLIKNFRYVDDTIYNLRYDYTIDDLIKHNISINAHGDDVTYSLTGEELYLDIKEAGMHRTFPRTKGICSTDIIASILQFDSSFKNNNNHKQQISFQNHDLYVDKFTDLLEYHCNGSSTALQDYCSINAELAGCQVIVGNFDIFTEAHLRYLQSLKRAGRRLIVGIKSDNDERREMGLGYPILPAIERALNAFSYKDVDGVILCRDDMGRRNGTTTLQSGEGDYSQMKKADEESQKIIERVLYRREHYEKRNQQKQPSG